MMEEMAVETTASGSPVPGVLMLVASILVIMGGWKMFAKAGKPGWAIIVPIYNAIVIYNAAQCCDTCCSDFFAAASQVHTDQLDSTCIALRAQCSHHLQCMLRRITILLQPQGCCITSGTLVL